MGRPDLLEKLTNLTRTFTVTVDGGDPRVLASRPDPHPTSSLKTRIALPAEEAEVVALRRALVAKLTYGVGKDPIVASNHDWFVATALTMRDRIVSR